MGKTKRYHVGELRTKPSDLTKNRGHEYGAGRSEQKHTSRKEKRAKQKLKNEFYSDY